MNEKTKTVHLRITGRVQGVYFRAWTAEQATQRKLRGWVRNRRDGSVEALFSGEPDAVQAMIALCWSGPVDACVESVEIVQEGGAAPAGFRVLETI